MTTSTSEFSKSSSSTRFFYEDMKRDLFVMMDMVKEMYEDERKSTKLREKLNSVKEEKQLLFDKLHKMESQHHIENMNLERMHELKTQLLVAKEVLVNTGFEEEVNNPSLSSILCKNVYVGFF